MTADDAIRFMVYRVGLTICQDPAKLEQPLDGIRQLLNGYERSLMAFHVGVLGSF